MASARAATALVPLLQASAGLPGGALWRADELYCPPSRSQCVPTGFAALDAELPGGGWPRGQIIELLIEQPGIGELGLLMPALAATSRSCVWVLPGGPHPEDRALPYAPALEQAGIDTTRHIFVRPEGARQGAWALEQSLRAGHLGAVLGWLSEPGGMDADFRALRRLHLLAHRGEALVFVLRPARAARAPSPAPLRLQLEADEDGLQVRLLKRRGRPLLEPIALQVHPQRWSRARAAAPASAEPSLLQRLTGLVGRPQPWAQALPE